MEKISGVDDCRGGWLAFHFDGNNWSEHLYKRIDQFYSSASDSKLILIDIPIGLRTSESLERLCDMEPREILKNRVSTFKQKPFVI